MGLHFLVLQHTEWEGPGTFLIKAARRFKLQLHIVRAWQERIPLLSSYDGLIVLGGSPNVGQVDKYPFLNAEKEAIRNCIAENRPYLGFCLGHQLLAEALGARIDMNFMPSIGFTKGYLTCEGCRHPVFSGFQRIFTLFKWHSQAIQEPLPKNISLLVTSKECQIEAISVYERPHIVGLQFDNHAASLTDVKQWLQRDETWLKELLGDSLNSRNILESAQQLQNIMADEFNSFFHNYLHIIGY